MKKIFLATISLMLIFSITTSSVSALDEGGTEIDTSELAEHAPGELLVRFSPGMNSSQLANKMKEMGVTPKREIQAIKVHLVKLPPGLSVEKAIERFSHLPGVEYVEPNYILHIAETNHTEISDQWGMRQIHTEEAWNALGGNEKNEILLATVDTGIKRDNSEVSSKIWANPAETPNNGIDDDGNGFVDDTWGWDFVNSDNNPVDDQMHGTAVTSVMVASQDGTGMVGICPWCKVMGVKVLDSSGSGYLDTVANGITYAANNGARVINLSLAGSAGSQTLQNAVNYAWGQGSVVVAAAGNDGQPLTLFPAGYTNAIAVASTNWLDKHSCFSNYNPGYISVSAPGEAVYVVDINSPTGFNYYSGTSLSTPHVTGLAGLILGKNPNLTNSQVRSILENSSVDLGSPGFDSAFGYGRIDALRAVTEDFSQITPPDGLSSASDTATGYAHARKLVRDGQGTLHLIWHTTDSSGYRIRYATSSDNGNTWDIQPDVFSSTNETYHPALAADDNYLYVAIPSRVNAASPYQILFSRKPIASGTWPTPVALMGGTYNAVRPDMYVDKTNGKLHLIASSLDDSPYLFYRASNDQGGTRSSLNQINITNSSSNTRYASIYSSGNNVYIATRTVSSFLFTYYYLYTARSTDGGVTWIDKTQLSSYLAFSTGEYGVSLAGVGDRLYMGYEVGSNIYFRRNDGAGWGNLNGPYTQLETGDPDNVYKWPTITQADDGQAWMMFEVNGQLYMRHYDGATWEDKQYVSPGSYANLKRGTGGGMVEWVSTICNGSPFDLSYGSLNLGSNLPPRADNQAVTTDEDVPVNITLAGTDPDNDPLTYMIVSQPIHGTLSGIVPNLTYTPSQNYNGSDSFTFKVNDGQTDSAVATVAITLTAVNDPPVANGQSVSTPEDTSKVISLIASDVDNDTLTYSVVSSPTHGVLNGVAPNLTYTPNLNYNGSDSFTFKTNDGQVDSNVATVTITVTPVNDPPVANDQSVDTSENTPLVIALTASDVDSVSLTYSVISGPSNGTLSGTLPNLTYTPDNGFNGSDGFTFKANDGQADSNIATISITITPVAISVDALATGEVLVGGTISGSITDTYTDNGIYESITERESGGKPQSRYSYLDHKWVFNVVPGNLVTLYANVWSGGSSDGDSFIFAYSTDDSNYFNIFTVNSTSPSNLVTINLPSSIQGTIYLRVFDSDHASGHRTLDTVYVDQLYIRSETQPGTPPDAPTNLTVTALAATQIDLVWADNADNESGFYIERSLNETDWTQAQITTVGANVTSYADSTVSPSTTYHYRVRAFNSYGTSGYSSTASATTDPFSTEMMQVSSLAPNSVVVRSKWNATVEILVTASDGDTPIANAVVSGFWSDGATGTVECTTDSNGLCTVTKNSIKTSVPSVTFTVTSVTQPSYIYDSENSIVTIPVYQNQ